MGPHAKNLDDAFGLENLVHQTVLDANPTGLRSAQITEKLLEGRRSPEWILREKMKKLLGFKLQPR